MLAAQVMTELRTKHGLTGVSVRDLYKHRTIRAFAQHLAAEGAVLADTPAEPDADARTPSQRAFESVPRWERWTTVAIQTFALLIYEAILIAPVGFFVWLVLSVLDHSLSMDTAFLLGTTAGFAIWPAMLFISVAVKWLVVGRFKPGAYPVWSLYYCRWWIANLFQRLSWSHMFEGSPLMSFYMRAMGARVGRNTSISTSICSAFDLVSIGDDVAIGPETHISGYRVEDGLLKLGRIDIGHDCFVGMHCAIGLDTVMKPAARLDDMSHLADGVTVAAGEGMRGALPTPTIVPVPAPEPRAKRRPILFGIVHLLLIYAMGYFLILTGLPAIALVAYALFGSDVYVGVAAVVLAVPASVLWYVACLVAIKKLFIGKIEAGRYPLHSARYVRLWFYRYLLANTRQLLMPIYSTLFVPHLYRLLGARIGKRAEMSTVNQVIPELMEVGDGSFLADECLIGGIRIFNGVAELKPVKIGQRSFIGNSALVRGGVMIGDETLIGVMSTPPADTDVVPENSQWLGAPGFPLPRPQTDIVFDESRTFNPNPKLERLRMMIDVVRITLPAYLSTAVLGAMMALSAVGFQIMPWWAVLLALPLIANLVAAFSILVVAAIKHAVMGTFTPSSHPLWSPFVWLNDVVNGVFEGVAALAMSPFMGTPFIAPFLRAMGCRVGKWCFIDTTLFTEYDLVEIGDYAALNLGSTMQTHLFEDRVMKSDVLKIGEGCAVGNMAIVLYSTEMQRGSSLGALSVLMKGETLPPMSRWRGIPSEQVNRVPAKTPTSPADTEALAKMVAAQ